MQARVVVYLKEKEELCVPLDEAGAGIGRDSGNPVQLTRPEVSKKHAFIKRVFQGWHIQDLNSRNGLFVNDKKVSEAYLKHGDRITVGPYTLVFDLCHASQPYAPVIQIDVTDDAELKTMPSHRVGP